MGARAPGATHRAAHHATAAAALAHEAADISADAEAADTADAAAAAAATAGNARGACRRVVLGGALPRIANGPHAPGRGAQAIHGELRGQRGPPPRAPSFTLARDAKGRWPPLACEFGTLLQGIFCCTKARGDARRVWL